MVSVRIRYVAPPQTFIMAKKHRPNKDLTFDQMKEKVRLYALRFRNSSLDIDDWSKKHGFRHSRIRSRSCSIREFWINDDEGVIAKYNYLPNDFLPRTSELFVPSAFVKGCLFQIEMDKCGVSRSVMHYFEESVEEKHPELMLDVHENNIGYLNNRIFMFDW